MGGAGDRAGVARSGLGSVVGLAVVAVAIVAAVVLWPQGSDESASTAGGAKPASAGSTTTTPEPRRQLRHWVDSVGNWFVLSEDSCSLLDGREISDTLGLEQTARPERSFEPASSGNWCRWHIDGHTVASYILTGGRGLPPRESLLESYDPDFDIRHPDACPYIDALVTRGCYRLAKVPRLGEDAWAISLVTDWVPRRPWVIDSMRFQRNGHAVSFDASIPTYPDDGPARQLELARLLDSRLRAAEVVVVDPVCQPELRPEDC